jgi:hypothetical protein
MKRREFVIKTGIIITASAFLGACDLLRGTKQESTDGFVLPQELDTPMLKAIGFGVTAPNPHNTQAWKFRLHSDTEMSLYVDESRLLPETDPPTRQIHIGQGTFIEALSVGAGSLGYRTEVGLFPAGEYGLDEIGKKPVANIRLVKDSEMATDPLFYEIPKRRTNRKTYGGDYVTDDEFSKISSLVQPSGAELRFLNDPKDMLPLLEIFYEAMEVETNTYRTYEETRIWFRFSDREVEEKRDGLSLGGNGVTGLRKWLAETFFLSSQNWHSESNKQTGLDLFKEAVLSSRGLIYIKTRTNTQRDWVQAGRNYARLHLAVTKLDLAMHPLSQVLQEYAEMVELQQRFNSMMGVSEPAKIQMIARVGRSSSEHRSPRRPVKSMIVW